MLLKDYISGGKKAIKSSRKSWALISDPAALAGKSPADQEAIRRRAASLAQVRALLEK
jgi:hypothetical protein